MSDGAVLAVQAPEAGPRHDDAARLRHDDAARLRHDALRAEVRRIASVENRPMTEIAKQVGTPYGTFSQWAAGTYAGRWDKIDDTVRRWLDQRTTAQTARAALPTGPSFVVTPAAQLFIATLEHAQHAPDLAVIAGAAGVGKTTAALAYQRQATNVWIITGEPCLTTPKMLLDELADVLGVSEWRGSHRISRGIVARLRDTRGLLIVDEAQHLRTETLEQVRSIHDAADVGVALIGNERVQSRMDGGNRSPDFAQLFSRVGMRTLRPRPTKGDIEQLLNAWQVEGTDERRMLAAIARKPGALRTMIKTWRIASMQAAGGGEAVTVATIEMAFQHLAGIPSEAGK